MKTYEKTINEAYNNVIHGVEIISEKTELTGIEFQAGLEDLDSDIENLESGWEGETEEGPMKNDKKVGPLIKKLVKAKDNLQKYLEKKLYLGIIKDNF